MSKEFEAAFLCAEKPIFALAQNARALLYRLDPQIVEVVWRKQKIAGYGVGPKKMSEHYCYISVHKAHINIGFNYGADLPDPKNMLEGVGKKLRHIKIKDEKALAAPALAALLRAAKKEREAAFSKN